MHVVCTHEQADFDAVASLLGVWLLDRECTPVLPRRVNRNVRAFVTLYGEALPFLEFEDLPRRRVERLTVVDTQSPPSIKGVHPGTRIHIIDHHPPSDSPNPSWTSHIEEVGATATLLVEEIQEAGAEPDMLQATLLLLGIYEDTGSLSYAGTHPRDLRASAWLVEMGASLNLAADFLDHPLSNGQRALYDRLLESAETHGYQGLSVVIACGEAQGLAEEISTLAHKLRDVFDPDGLFVIVGLDGNVQLVARSTTDALDVGRVAEHFGGGGHDRAAAALIREKDVQQVREELLAVLDRMVKPPVTVGEIMSRDPQLLEPDVTIAEAAERMRRFGHEGYPVVEEGEVIGLLTRRAVDRAMAHGMGHEPVRRVMEAGNVTVQVEDSVDHLQRLMILHGWGQIPVIDPKKKAIVGIATRTDLINSLGVMEARFPEPSLREQLEKALPKDRLGLLRLVAAEAEERNDALYVVGGFVRDLILGEPSVDFDLVVEGDAIGLAKGLADRLGGRVSSHRRFGTAKWQLDLGDTRLRQALGKGGEEPLDLPVTLDFVTARTEFYPHPTALPSVRRGSIKLDLHRRDFTINTLALRLDGRYYGTLMDPWGGRRDLRDGKIRVLHSLSFVDDPTRMLRAVRLAVRLGFEIERRTLQLLEEALPLLDRVSGERIRGELDSIFEEVNLVAIMERLHEYGLLQAIHPALTWDAWLRERFEEISAFEPPQYWKLGETPQRHFLYYAIWLYRLPPQTAEEVIRRLRFRGDIRAEILFAIRLARFLSEMDAKTPPSQIVSNLEEGREHALVAAWLGSAGKELARQAIDRYLSEWRFVAPLAGGEILRELGVQPGPIYAQILWTLRAAWLDGRVTSEAEERAMLERLIRNIGNHG